MGACRRRVGCLFIIFVLLFSSISLGTEIDTTGGTGGSVGSQDIINALSTVGVDINEDNAKNVATMYGIIQAKYGDVFAAGFVGSMLCESSGDISAIEGVRGKGAGVGLIQWSFDRRVAFSEYSYNKAESSCDTVVGVVKSDSKRYTNEAYVTYIGPLHVQVEYVLLELDSVASKVPFVIQNLSNVGNITETDILSSVVGASAISAGYQWLGRSPSVYYKANEAYKVLNNIEMDEDFPEYIKGTVVKDESGNFVSGDRVVVPDYDSLGDAISSDDVIAVAMNIVSHYERSQYEPDKVLTLEQSRMYRTGLYAKAVYEVCSGKTLGDLIDTGSGSAIADSLSKSGIYSEDDLVGFCRLAEINVEEDWIANARRDNLSQSELSELVAWERNLEIGNHESWFIKTGRVIVVGLGIALIVWAILFYMAFWLDRVNNFIDINALSIISLGHFRLADELTGASYFSSSPSKSDVKTVDHRAVLTICFICIFAGVVIMTGTIFKIVRFIVNIATGLFK